MNILFWAHFILSTFWKGHIPKGAQSKKSTFHFEHFQKRSTIQKDLITFWTFHIVHIPKRAHSKEHISKRALSKFQKKAHSKKSIFQKECYPNKGSFQIRTHSKKSIFQKARSRTAYCGFSDIHLCCNLYWWDVQQSFILVLFRSWWCFSCSNCCCCQGLR